MPKKSTKSDTKSTQTDSKKELKKKTGTKKDDEKRSDSDRSRTWACIIYPDSAPENFREIIADSLVPCFLSPLHTDGDEEKLLEKKPHYHLVTRYEAVKFKEQFEEFAKTFKGAGAERIHDFRTYSRYLCHLDQPHKKRYNPADVVSFGGLDYADTIKSVSETEEELDQIVMEIITYCEDHVNEIQNSFARLLRYSMKERPDWFRRLRKDCAYIIEKYMKSADFDQRKARERLKLLDGSVVDSGTGEIIARADKEGVQHGHHSIE